jgi:hypothetical protein
VPRALPVPLAAVADEPLERSVAVKIAEDSAVVGVLNVSVFLTPWDNTHCLQSPRIETIQASGKGCAVSE